MNQPLNPEELSQLFQTIEGESTGKLSELAQIAGLNLAQDYIGADLSDEDLSRDNLSHANLSHANLSNSNFSNTNLSNANLTNANLSSANLSYAILSNADLSHANLSHANLFCATLNNTNLDNANLSHANCRITNFLYAKNLTTANVFRTFLVKATLGLSQKDLLDLKQRGAIIDEAKLVSAETVVSNRTINMGSGNYNERIADHYVQGSKKQSNFNSQNDLRDSQNAGGVVNADTVNAQRIGGDILNIRNFFFGQRDSSQSVNPRNHVQQILLKQVSTGVISRLEQSLHNRIYIRQDTDQNPSQIELPWASEVKVGLKPKVHLTNTQITAIYDQPDIAGRLLILGQPGVGKTTMLLKLAEELVNRAKNDPAHPIPVLFSLSSWKKDSQSIKDWLVDQLKDKYGVRKDIAKGLVNNQEIIPLLDGLDELAAERQEKCLVKINKFLHPSNWNNPLVICSRIEEYQLYKSLLQLNNSVELCLFTQEQVYQYLQSTGNLEFWTILSQDEDLKQLAQIPLILNIIVLSAQEISIQEWQQFQLSEERLSYLFDAYIRRMLKRPYKDKKNKNKKQPKPEQTQRWLGWLAQRLIEENATEFLIERMQPDWLKKKIQKIIYNLTLGGGILGGVILALFLGIFYYVLTKEIFKQSLEIIITILGVTLGVNLGIIFRGILQTIHGGIKIDIQPVEKLNFSIGKSLFLIIFWGTLGLILNSVSVEIGILVAISGMIYGLISGFEGQEVENKIIPNQGIRQSIINTIIISIIIWFLATLLIFLIQKVTQQDINFNQALFSNVVFALFLGLLIAIPRSGTPAIKHFVLRLVLCFRGYAPWNYAKFLDYCTNRLFLQRVGGGYRFMHDLLRQHFADSYSQKN